MSVLNGARTAYIAVTEFKTPDQTTQTPTMLGHTRMVPVTDVDVLSLVQTTMRVFGT